MITGNGRVASNRGGETAKGAAVRLWDALKAEDRLALVESALRTGADNLEGKMPVAL